MPCFPQNLYIWGSHADATIHIMLVKHTKADCITVGLLETLSGNKMFFLMDPPLFDYLTCKNLVQSSSFMHFPASVRLDVISRRFRSDFQFGFWSGLWWDIDMVFGKLSNQLCDFWILAPCDRKKHETENRCHGQSHQSQTKHLSNLVWLGMMASSLHCFWISGSLVFNDCQGRCRLESFPLPAMSSCRCH